jgi:hypothetical protein
MASENPGAGATETAVATGVAAGGVKATADEGETVAGVEMDLCTATAGADIKAG